MAEAEEATERVPLTSLRKGIDEVANTCQEVSREKNIGCRASVFSNIDFPLRKLYSGRGVYEGRAFKRISKQIDT
jgi:hypothetical protein